MTEPAVQPQEVQPHDRLCWGCGQTDDHPRSRIVRDLFGGKAHEEELYHYDCLPAFVAQQHPALHKLVEAAKKGVHGHELRKFGVKHATSIPEAPADAPVDTRKAQ